MCKASVLTGGNNYTIEGVQQLMSVPYALYAEHVGDIAHLDSLIENTNVPISIFDNDAGYITLTCTGSSSSSSSIWNAISSRPP